MYMCTERCYKNKNLKFDLRQIFKVFIQAGVSETLEIVLRYFISVP